jgi:uncharacterized membrane protein (DUF485 family)
MESSLQFFVIPHRSTKDFDELLLNLLRNWNEFTWSCFLFGIFFVVSADVFYILCICLSYFILNFLLESFISINISFLLGFSSFLMSFLLPVDLSPDGCIDPRMCVSPLCHFRRYSLSMVFRNVLPNIYLYNVLVPLFY